MLNLPHEGVQITSFSLINDILSEVSATVGMNS